jgi:hypothetical protein
LAQSLLAPQPQASGAASPQKLRPVVVTQHRHRSEEPATAQSVRVGGCPPALLSTVQIPWFGARRHLFSPRRPLQSPDKH